MTTDDVLRLLAERGFRLVAGPGGEPCIRGPRPLATPALLRVLAHHREQLIERLRQSHPTRTA